MLFCQVFGTATKPLISWLLPPQYRSTASDASGLSPKVSLDADFHIPLLNDTQQDDNSSIYDRTGISQILNGLPRPQSIGMLLTAPRSKIHHIWRKFDDAYMRPTFGGRGYVRLMSRRGGMDIPEEDEDEERDWIQWVATVPVTWPVFIVQDTGWWMHSTEYHPDGSVSKEWHCLQFLYLLESSCNCAWDEHVLLHNSERSWDFSCKCEGSIELKFWWRSWLIIIANPGPYFHTLINVVPDHILCEDLCPPGLIGLGFSCPGSFGWLLLKKLCIV